MHREPTLAPPRPACTQAARGARPLLAPRLSLSLALSLSLSLSLFSGPRAFDEVKVAHHRAEALGLHNLRDLVELLVLAEGGVELPLLVGG